MVIQQGDVYEAPVNGGNFCGITIGPEFAVQGDTDAAHSEFGRGVKSAGWGHTMAAHTGAINDLVAGLKEKLNLQFYCPSNHSVVFGLEYQQHSWLQTFYQTGREL